MASMQHTQRVPPGYATMDGIRWPGSLWSNAKQVAKFHLRLKRARD